MKRQITAVFNGRLFQTISCLMLTIFFSTQLMAQAPSIVNTLNDETICEGGSKSINITANNATSYQWQVNTGGGFVDVVNGANYSGATASFFSILAAPSSFSGNKYRCVVTGPSAPPATSNEMTLTVNTLVSITTQPTDKVICSGGSTTLSTTATGSGISAYQWYVHDGVSYVPITNGGIYSDATTSTLSITGITASPTAKTFSYTCTVTGACGGTTTDPAYVTVNALPAITTSPSNSAVCEGVEATFTVNATGTNLSYQWQISYTGLSWTDVVNGATYSNVTTNALKVKSDVSLDNAMYRCVVSGICTPDAISAAGTLTVNQYVSITTEPVGVTVCPGNTTNFGVGASGTGLTYQWQLNDGHNGWLDLVNTAFHSGVTTKTLTVSNVPSTYNGFLYRCMVSGVCISNVSTQQALLNVNTPVSITTQPTDKVICSGESTTLTMSAAGSGISGYQWFVHDGVSYVPLANGGFYSGVNTTTLSINNITSAPNAETFSYICSATGACGGSTTNPAYVTVNALPAITLQPVDDNVCEGLESTFTVDATGTNLSYQWQISYTGATWTNLTNNATYSNVTTKILKVISNVNLDGAMYRCVVSGTCAPDAISSGGKLTVFKYVSITTEPQSHAVCPGNTTNFGVGASGTGLTYQWQLNDGHNGWVDLVNTAFHSGVTTKTLTVSNVPLTYNGFLYRCMVSGTCISNVQTLAAELTVNTPLSISTQPTDKTICSGSSTSLTTAATGTGISSYQWFIHDGVNYVPLSNGGFYSGTATSTLAINNITVGTSAQTFSYICTVTGACGGTTTNPAYVTVNALPAVATHPTNKTICAGFATTFSTTATGTNPTYQWQVDDGGGWSNVANGGVYSNATTNTLSITGATATQNGYMYRCTVSGTCAPPANSNSAVLTVNTAPAIVTSPTDKIICTGGNTSFSASATGAGLTYQWEVNTGSGWTNLANGGIYSDVTTSTLSLTGATSSVNGNKYRCTVSGTCLPPASTAMATLTINTPPAITSHPSNIATCPSGNASFSVAATGAGLTYQWEVNDGGGWTNVSNTGIYSGATTAMLQLTAATAIQNGYKYRCVVSGTCTPATTSNDAELTIDAIPAITTGPTNKVICLNDNTTFTVAATGTSLTYQWQVSTNGTLWTNQINTSVYSGVNTATLSITSAPEFINGYMYRCVVSGACTPPATSTAATLTVNKPTIIVSNPAPSTICPAGNTSFSVSATGTALGYQWQVNTGSGWSNVANGGVYNGATTASLSLTNVTTSFNTYQYRCVVSGSCAPTSLPSSSATLTVNSNVAITTHPTSKTICSGGSTSLTTSATGTGISSYQWYVHNGVSYVALSNGGVYSGAGTNTLSISGITTGTTATTLSYTCTVTGTCGGTTTNPASVTVNALPAISSNPSNVTVCDSTNNISFSITATGTGLTYQWQVDAGSGWTNVSNNSSYSGTTTRTLTIQQAWGSMNNNKYRCVVSGTCTPSVNSSSAELTVNPLLLPAVSITQDKNDVCAGTLVRFTATPTNGGTSPTYKWKVNNVTVLTTTSNQYASTTLSNSDIVSCEMLSNATCVSSSSVHSNQLTMLVTQYQTPTVTISSPSGTSSCSGVAVVFNASSTFAGANPTYQWRVNGLPAGTDSVAFSTSTLDSNDLVSVVMTSDFKCPSPSTVASNTIKMLVNQTKVATVSIATASDTSICKGAPVKLFAYYTHSGANPQFEWYRNGTIMPGQTTGTMSTSQINDNDVYTCRFISSQICVVPVLSAPLTFNIDNPVTPAVDVQVSYNGDNEYIFAAIPTNGGTNPSYQWFVNGKIVGNAIHPTYATRLLTPSAQVSVIMTSNHPCITTNTATSRNVTTGIGNSQELLFDNLTLYPNPNSGTFTLAGEYEHVGTTNAVVTITNTLGQQVYKEEMQVTSGELKHTVNMNSNPATGTYIMRIEIDGRQDIRRFNIVR